MQQFLWRNSMLPQSREMPYVVSPSQYIWLTPEAWQDMRAEHLQRAFMLKKFGQAMPPRKTARTV
jgi:hypothetical protein